MPLKSSLVIFQALEPLQPQRPHRPLQPQWPQQPLKPYFIKELPDLDDWIVPGTKMTNGGSFLWNALCGTSVLLTDRKRTPQILRAKTLRVLRQT